MAEIKTKCPNCRSRYEVEADILGQNITCPRCHIIFKVEPYMPPVIPVTPVRKTLAAESRSMIRTPVKAT